MNIGRFTYSSTPAFLTPEARARHCYVIGQTGTGKSTLLENMAIGDLKSGNGLAFIDPHGSSARSLLSHIPPERCDQLIYIDVADLEHPVGLNFIGGIRPDDRSRVADNIVAAFVHIFGEQAVADRSQALLRNTLLALMETEGSTLLSAMHLLRNADYRERVVAGLTDPLPRSYWTDEFAGYDDKFREQVTAPILNKLDAILSHPAVRHILSQPVSSVDLRHVMDEGQILIVNLSKGRLGEKTARVFGSFLVSALTQAALSREDIEDEAKRRPFYLYADEFQNFVTPDFATALSEARKYRLSLTLANQLLDQVPGEIRAAVFGNVGTYIAFRLGPSDAEIMAPNLDVEDEQLVDMRNFRAWFRSLEDGAPGKAHIIETLPRPKAIHNRSGDLIANSRRHFARERAYAERIVRRLFRS